MRKYAPSMLAAVRRMSSHRAAYARAVADCVFFICYSTGSSRRWLLLRFVLMLAAVGALSASAVFLVPAYTTILWPDKKAKTMTNVLGLICTVFNVCMYGAPLAVVRTVIRQRSVQSMPLALTLCTGFCSACWTCAHPPHTHHCPRSQGRRVERAPRPRTSRANPPRDDSPLAVSMPSR